MSLGEALAESFNLSRVVTLRVFPRALHAGFDDELPARLMAGR